jgi:hypothetical protein
MKQRKRAQRRGAQRVAKRKQHYQMTAEPGRYVVTGKPAKRSRTVTATIDDDALDRINGLPADQQRQLRYYLKVSGLEHIAPPRKDGGRPKKPKPK